MEYTVIGKIPQQPAILSDKDRFSLVILGRGGRQFRSETLAELFRAEPAEILTMESGKPIADYENLSDRYPRARFYFVHDGAGPGALINLAAKEVQSEHFLVVWSDTRLIPAVLSSRLLYSLMDNSALCQVPWIVDEQGNCEPSRIIPVPGSKGALETWISEPSETDRDTLFPYDYTGFYKRNLFLNCGGYDEEYRNNYWQKLDFGFRMRMMGYRLFMNGSLRLVHSGQYPLVEDTTRDSDYSRFVLKNLLPRFRKDRLILPHSRFLSWWKLSGLPFSEALQKYRKASSDLKANRGQYLTDLSMILETWDNLS